mmetsp:Transcript_70902/g.191671  ORF Transcript_70902/g.191671 Transcript_70902/m.191671 type:complete len:549 (+) Transcript_70902:3-1649(+)
MADQPLQAAEEGGAGSPEGSARPLLGYAPTPAPRRGCPGRPSCCVCAGVILLTVSSALCTVGIWLNNTGDPDKPPEAARQMLMVGVRNANGSGAGEAEPAPPCDNPVLCSVEAGLESVDAGLDGAQRWDGWSRVMPFFFSSTATTGTTQTATDSTTTSSATDTATSVSRTMTSTITTITTPCMVLEEGDGCYREVLDVLHDIRDNPDSRDGLTMWSSFEEVQTWLHQNEKKSKCLDACECQVVPVNSKCYSSLVFARESGIREHPEWYPNLTEKSSTYDFQEYLWKYVNDTECPRPCKAFPRSETSLFCWSVARQWGYEGEVMRAQLAAGAGIFGCDGFAVVSEDEWSVGQGPGGRLGEVNTLSFPGAPVGVSKDGTAGNAQLFMNAWDAVLGRTLLLDFDWGIKADPDAVIVADRLRDHVKDQTGSNVYVRNCRGDGNNPEFPMMFGSLEAITRQGLQAYKDGKDRCRSELNWYSWGEDLFLGKCLLHLGVGPVDDFSIISDGVCAGVNCNDGWSAAFHPFKGSNEWMNCWNTVKNNLGGPPHPPLP